MSQFHKTLVQVSVMVAVVFSLLTPAQAVASSNIKTEGKILALSRDSINVNDLLFPIIATVKVKVPGKKNARLSDIKVGNFVQIELQKYNGKLYVDSIYLISKPTANE